MRYKRVIAMGCSCMLAASALFGLAVDEYTDRHLLLVTIFPQIDSTARLLFRFLAESSWNKRMMVTFIQYVSTPVYYVV